MHKLTIEEMGRLDLEGFHNAPKTPVVLVLDNIRSQYNVGSIFRTADAFRIERICLCGITGCPPSVEIHKTALGAEDSVAWSHHPDTPSALAALRRDGYRIWAVEQVEGSLKLTDPTLLAGGDADPTSAGKYALVLGNEVKGVSQDALDLCDAALEIPQYGTKHSFNVSVTAGIVLWEVCRRLGVLK